MMKMPKDLVCGIKTSIGDLLVFGTDILIGNP